MGVVSKNWSDRSLLSILYMFQTLMFTDGQTPFLGTPLAPLKLGARNLPAPGVLLSARDPNF